jgi:hypothetical protein
MKSRRLSISKGKRRLTSDSTLSKIVTRVRYAQHIVINHEETINDQYNDYEN